MQVEGTKDRVLASARDLFVERGPGAVSMRAVARQAGVTAMAIYRHFENRPALLQAVLEQGFAIFLGYLQRALAQPTPWERLWHAGDQYLAFALEHPRDYALLFMEPDEDRHGKGPRIWQEAATFRFLVDRIRECVDCSVLGAGDPEQLATTVWAQCHGLVSLYLAGKLGLTEAAFRHLYATSLVQLALGFTGANAPPVEVLMQYTLYTKENP
jgi:AcrR family transcriptional regulator